MQDPAKDCVSLTLTHSGTSEVLNLSLPDYSGVLVDCLQGECWEECSQEIVANQMDLGST